jgi:hypothetical protein
VWRYARDSGATPERAMFAVEMVDVLMATTILKREAHGVQISNG